MVILRYDGTLKANVYRELTQTDQYLHFDANHHVEHKRPVVTALLRVDHLV